MATRTVKYFARRSDPATSFGAAPSSEKRARQHAAIMQVFLGRPGVKLAAEQVGDILGYPIWRRLHELREAGSIRWTGTQHRNRSGKLANHYEVVPKPFWDRTRGRC
jgi:hypothetical protein